MIEPGAELDRAVAKAIGMGWWDVDGYVSYDVPRYSKDLNAAFAAAERVGLFDGNQLGKWTPWEYCVISSCEKPDERDIIGRAATPALAICAAILKLKPISDESDQIQRPPRPDLRCEEHGGLCSAVRLLQRAVVELEERVRKLESSGAETRD